MNEMLEGRDDNFEQILSSHDLVLADFWAEWCIPCKQLDPVMKKLVGDGVTVVKLDADDTPEISERYWVAGLPALLLFQKGVLIARRVGFVKVRPLREWIERSVATFSQPA